MPNQLCHELSPYLLQHAGNPVDWRPWGEEALTLARTERKPIFLSIGYAACHWCHVMERESFEDDETARILNEHFIAIKVDREERPDVDEIYMASVQMMTGSGGWPLSVFLTPNLEPFFGGAYFPPEDHYGLPGFQRVLRTVAELWQKQPDQIAGRAKEIARTLQASMAQAPSIRGSLDASLLANAAEELRSHYDPVWGGFGGPPKFPDTGAIAVLLRQYRHTEDHQLLEMVAVTLDKMAYGGIHDQMGGGFHRYAVDASWLTPHFEKMLYDNALLANAYLEAWQATGKELYRRVAADTLDDVLREMSDRRGGFHSSQDADSEGKEGTYYLWRRDEIEAVLGKQDGGFFCEYYGVSEAGNFEGSNILHVPQDPETFAHRHGLSERQLHDRLTPLRCRLLAARDRRIPPSKDDKVLAAWNGMIISALAHAYQVLGQRRYLEAAEQTADFVLRAMFRDGTLLRVYRGVDDKDGVSKLPGYLDDYAEVSCALVDLYEAGFNLRWLRAANQLAGRMLADFWDEQHGGFFYTSVASENLLVRTKPVQDGPVPSGNSTAALALLRLSKLLDNQEYFDKAEVMLEQMADDLRKYPRAYLRWLGVADFYLHPTCEIIIAGRREGDDTQKMLGIVHQRFIPNKMLALADPDVDIEVAEPMIPWLAEKPMVSGKATVYVCERATCKQPATDAATLENVLKLLR
jgi:uncharacterized protein YyaL (SSP411 family)